MNCRIRRSLGLLLSLTTILLLFSGFTSPSSVKVTPIGDVTGDGGVTSSDARVLIRRIVEGTSFDDAMWVSDCDENGLVDTTDARAILTRAMLETPVSAAAEGLPLSSYSDVTGASRMAAYEMTCDLTDTYLFECAAVQAIEIMTLSGNSIATGQLSMEAALTAGKTYRIEVTTFSPNQSFTMNVTAKNHVKRLPYQAHFTSDPEDYSTTSASSANPLQRAEVNYTKREGGTYIYANNPEVLAKQDVGQALLRDEGLTGDVEFTWEHSNQTGRSIYLGYQLKNEGDRDVFITVTNVGMQVQGEWLGQQSWSDYYNMKFDLPQDYFNADGSVAEPYVGQDFIDYTPRVFQPTTYRLPAGQYIYVVGGTSNDAYNRTNVANTANKMIYVGKCSNAVVKFHVAGGSVTGTFYCYTTASQVQANPEEQGYVVLRENTSGVETSYGAQYKGSASHQGLIETNLAWTFNDNTTSGNLPVSYTSYYNDRWHAVGDAYRVLPGVDHTVSRSYWTTHINPQANHVGVGVDMVEYACETVTGDPVVIDVNHADGRGKAANLGNWMIDYQDNYTFVNQGNRDREITVHKSANGALMAFIMDRDGNVLATKCTIQQLNGGKSSYNYDIYTMTIPAHSVVQITASFLLMGNSNGNVTNSVYLK
ncbi:MAG: dockerin type I repeat-containing protein [Clostridia bacterium]|nr:dockerin type I repeat-containing protein [Clostridia bacterium]